MKKLLFNIRCYLKMTKLGSGLARKRYDRARFSPDRFRACSAAAECSGAERETLLQDMQNEAKAHLIAPEEYVYFHFENKNEQERRAFIGDREHMDIVEALNKPKNQKYFDDKGETAKAFAPYFHRAFCVVYRGTEKERTAFSEFTGKHKKFIVKPLFGAMGSGVRIFDSAEEDASLDRILSMYAGKNGLGFIAEELIVQDDRMAVFHPKSVNTVRVPTFVTAHGVEIFHPFMRLGRGDSVVDNAGAGGLICLLDGATGRVIAVSDENGNSYTNHPDTGLEMVGFQVPEWEEAVRLAKELATVVKGNRYAGWDLALTKDGWCMVEGNARGQFIWQIVAGRGCRSELETLLKA